MVQLRTDWQGGHDIEPGTGRKVCYSRFNMEWPQTLGVKLDVIFDVGAYDGADAIRFKRAFPDAKVVSVEGDPIRAAAIRKAIVENNIDITFVEAIALDREGFADWYQGGDHTELGTKNGSIFYWPKKPLRPPENHPCTTLLNICQSLGIEKIDLLHIDVEGAELFVLRGLDPIHPRLIWAEVADAWPDAPGSVATHKEITDRGYKQIFAAHSDRLYRKD